MSVEDRVLETIRPDEGEERQLGDVAAELLRLLNDDGEVGSAGIIPRLEGSVAKGTHLRGTDLDIFLVFPKDSDFERMVSCCARLGSEHLEDLEKRFADHPYVHGIFQGFDVDLVPCYHMSPGDRVRSAVDRTPLHTRHIIETMGPDQRDDARLLKAFMKGIGVYGADSENRGFSGYLTELLVIHYGGFLPTLGAVSAWKYGERLGGDGPEHGHEPLVFIDPVDNMRNVASAVHVNSFALMIHASSQYLREPDMRFFFPRDRPTLTPSEAEGIMERRGSRLLSVIIQTDGVSEDNLHSQAYKSINGLRRLLERKGFSVLRSFHAFESELHIVLELETDVLPATEIHQGPPAWVDDAYRFLDKWKDPPLGPPFLEEGRWNVHRIRQDRVAADCIVNNIKEVSLGASLDMDRLVVKDHHETLQEGSMKAVSLLLDTRFPWEF